MCLDIENCCRLPGKCREDYAILRNFQKITLKHCIGFIFDHTSLEFGVLVQLFRLYSSLLADSVENAKFLLNVM